MGFVGDEQCRNAKGRGSAKGERPKEKSRNEEKVPLKSKQILGVDRNRNTYIIQHEPNLRGIYNIYNKRCRRR
jgi:hypothetical protein